MVEMAGMSGSVHDTEGHSAVKQCQAMNSDYDHFGIMVVARATPKLQNERKRRKTCCQGVEPRRKVFEVETKKDPEEGW